MSMRIKLVLVVVVILLEHYNHGAKAAADTNPNQLELVKPGCSATCGSLVVPYPFGTTPGCYFNDDFFISCNNTITDGGGGGGYEGVPKAFFRGRSDFVILNISLERQEMRVSRSMSKSCLEVDETGNVTSYSNEDNNPGVIAPKAFRISSRRNKFTTVGCNLFGLIQTVDQTISSSSGSKKYSSETSALRGYIDACVSTCTIGIENVQNGTCHPHGGCCQTPIAIGDINHYTTSLDTISEDFRSVKLCGYAFVTEEEEFKFSSLDLIKSLDNRKAAPLVLDWAVRNHINCAEARSRKDYACKAKYSDCLNSTNGPGYICKCRKGYQGNPYLLHGCQDINECASEKLNPCSNSATCINNPGGVTCTCSEGYIGDGKEAGTGCTHQFSQQLKLLVIAFGICTGILVLVTVGFWIYLVIKRRRLIKLKRMFFEQNGGVLLQQHLNLSRHKPSIEIMKIFSSDELIKATNNYDKSNILGQGGNGTVYKGVLRGNKIVAIKRSKTCDRSQIGEFINEGIVLSQVNHRNVVKLLGCCLETEVPVLVYEFITNGTLASHLHPNQSQPLSITLSWQMRLKIAAEIAGALAYLHSETCMPIIHRDVKTSNILLDDNFTAKVADFGASRLVPLGQTQLTTLLQGTIGYLDPEYLYNSQLTDKSDVFSFGVILAELLTGKTPLIFKEGRKATVNLAVYFVSCVEEECLHEILDDQVAMDDQVFEVLKQVASVAVMCLRTKREERPAMKEVAAELEILSKM
ncbi:wall-associated receptor kinase 3-like [Rosa rugosa]|uniref:wall-associated receptor kinase 3-like n=1 Tax=Rosa rugosa TaxID=74645 RepID=UPI002B4062E6|nr:wall-associated receptor kinase 3-like [Rosa rugosa]